MTNRLASRTATATAVGAAEWEQPKILTIDDDPNIAQALQRLFHRFDVVVLQAYHGMHGVWLATVEMPDVIVTDLRMPQGQGQNVVDYLRRNPKTRHIPIIVLTGLRDPDLERRMWKLGIDGYLTKPVDFQELCAVVGRYVPLQERAEEQ
jgi:response regulator RpfG family c-di-GMP phosphodiesterase